jgi:hypothetical protein
MGGHTPRHWERLADVLAENARRLGSDADPSGFRNLVEE